MSEANVLDAMRALPRTRTRDSLPAAPASGNQPEHSQADGGPVAPDQVVDLQVVFGLGPRRVGEA